MMKAEKKDKRKRARNKMSSKEVQQGADKLIYKEGNNAEGKVLEK
jgi:hypothetical protein